MSTKLLHEYTPQGNLTDVFTARDPEVLVSGPAGTGKSRACLEKVHLMALLNPGMRGLLVRKTLKSLTSTGLVTWKEFVAKEALEAGSVEWYGGSAQEAAQYRYVNGSTITVGGMDNPNRIMSSEYDIIYVQEAIELTVTDWESITTRLRHNKISFQQLLADCNPDTPTHWLKMRCEAGTTRMIHSRHEDNPTLVNEDGSYTELGKSYLSKLDNLTGARYHRLRHGRWVSSEGIIYDRFDPIIHVIDQFPVPRDWVRYWAVDFGFNNPFVCQFWAQDPDGRLYLYREVYRSQKLVEEHAKDILALVIDDEGEWTEPKPRALVTDHDLEGRHTLEKYLGIATTPADKTIKIEEGIQAVSARYKVQRDGKPRIFFMKDAVVEQDPFMVEAAKPTSTIEEIPGYVWAETKDGKADKEEPNKVDDHGMDAKRYVVTYIDIGGRPNIRWM